MKTKNLLYLLVLLPLLSYTQVNTLQINGKYMGKNLFLKNTFTSDYGYCAFDVKINGLKSTAEVNSDIVEVFLDQKDLGLKRGDSVAVTIQYRLDCSPKKAPSIMNPGCLLSYSNTKNKLQNSFIIEGEFTAGSLLVFNPYNNKTNSYCLKKVIIDNKPFKVDLNHEIVSIDLYKMNNFGTYETPEELVKALEKGTKEGDKIKIEFIYSKDNDPTIINPELIAPSTKKK